MEKDFNLADFIKDVEVQEEVVEAEKDIADTINPLDLDE
jgi:hypothetical protein|tara:strand:- start:497 stop:613 length:117 start_codon:yes stop_codon:yes gene_type:complete